MSTHLTRSNNAFDAGGGVRLDIRSETRWGYLVIVLFFGGIVAWSMFAPLSTAAIAPGIVTVDGYRKTVQHLEGGIVSRIHVHDGDRVRTGQPLLELQRVASESEFDRLDAQRALVAALEARLVAEDQAASRVQFPDWLLARQAEPEIGSAIEDQRDIFAKRTQRLTTQRASLQREVAEARTELASFSDKAEALQKQRRLVTREVREFRDMVDKGLVPRTQLYSRQRLVTEVDAGIGDNSAALAGVEQRIAQLEARIESLANDQASEVAESLRAARESRIDIEHRMSRARDKLDRTTLRAPVDGIVVNLQAHTIGGVIRQGEAVLEIVPEGEALIVEARIEPQDRDNVSEGMPAEVRLSAFNQRAFQPVAGEVVHVSADAVQRSDPANGELSSFYRAKIRFTDDPSDVLGGALVKPGMQAEVLIVTGERSAIEYFTAPLFRSFGRAMHEQ